ncbi:hypothetical protein FNV43_RR20185 [Rhamnella rubrinervis]|uniref:Crossover junction endonuclease MUS81 n=1 Tax=Rhamnella rubrinervis TaxID=2594499 RepID=A0A8K0DTY6_9ROSA|nr:hypothetical protein FNV43_RR20185 [Rhamnella rubrinervis]
MGYPKEHILKAFREIAEPSNRDISSLWPSVLCLLREDDVYGFPLKSQSARKDFHTKPTTNETNEQVMGSSQEGAHRMKFGSAESAPNSITLRACSSSIMVSSHEGGDRLMSSSAESAPNSFTMRACSSSARAKIRRLPVGDGIWIARHKFFSNEYMLNFIVERKNNDDLRCSIRDNRYKDQKLRLLRCGLKKLIYLVEGDPNSSEAAESIKTACFTTEVLEGFDVQRASSLSDTLKKYGHLTQAITQYFKSQIPEEHCKDTRVCPTFNEFIKGCQDLDKMTVSDVFAIQLMQGKRRTVLQTKDSFPALVNRLLVTKSESHEFLPVENANGMIDETKQLLYEMNLKCRAFSPDNSGVLSFCTVFVSVEPATRLQAQELQQLITVLLEFMAVCKHAIRIQNSFREAIVGLSSLNGIFCEVVKEVEEIMKGLSPVMFEDFVKPFQINLEEDSPLPHNDGLWSFTFEDTDGRSLEYFASLLCLNIVYQNWRKKHLSNLSDPLI